MRTLLIGLVVLTVACRRPSAQFSAMLIPATQPDDYSRHLKAGDELVAVGSEPTWSLTINPARNVMLFKGLAGDSLSVPVPERESGNNGTFQYQDPGGRIKVRFVPDSCVDKLSGQRYDYHVDVTSEGKNYAGCGVSLRQLTSLQAGWILTDFPGHTLKSDNALVPRLAISLTQGRVTGTTGCNQLNGPVRADTRRIQFGPLTTTKMACADDSTQLESNFLNVLAQPLAWRVEGSNLTLLRNGKPIMTFKRVE